MNIVFFLTHYVGPGLNALVLFCIPLVGIIGTSMGAIAIRRSRHTANYRWSWVMLWAIATSWASATVNLFMFARFPGELGAVWLYVLPIAVGVLAPSIVILYTLIHNCPFTIDVQRRYYLVAPSLVFISATIIVLNNVALRTRYTHWRFPGIESGFFIYLGAWWWIQDLRKHSQYYRVMWPIATTGMMYVAYLASQFIVETIILFLNRGLPIDFRVNERNARSVIIWMIDEPSLAMAAIAVQACLLCYPPIGNAAVRNRAWAFTAIAMGVATLYLICGTIIPEIPT